MKQHLRSLNSAPSALKSRKGWLHSAHPAPGPRSGTRPPQPATRAAADGHAPPSTEAADTAPRRPATSLLPGGDARPCGKSRSRSGEGRGAGGTRHQLAVGEREAAVCFGNFTYSHNETESGRAVANRSESQTKCKQLLEVTGEPPGAAPKGTGLEIWKGQGPASGSSSSSGYQPPRGQKAKAQAASWSSHSLTRTSKTASLKGPNCQEVGPMPRTQHPLPQPGQLLLQMGTRVHRLHAAASSSQLPGARACGDPRDGPGRSCPGPAPSTPRRTARPRQAALALCLLGQTTALLGEKYPQLPQVFKYFQQLYKNLFPW